VVTAECTLHSHIDTKLSWCTPHVQSPAYLTHAASQNQLHAVLSFVCPAGMLRSSLGRSKLWAPAGAFLLLLLVLDPGVLASRHSEPAHAEIDSYSSGEPHQRRTGTPAAASLPKGVMTVRIPPTPPVRAQALSCPGDTNVVPLSAGANLYAVARTAGKTYQLSPGNYTISLYC
jgi:hypothetical protein